MSKLVEIEIIAKVKATVEIEDGEDALNVTHRDVDIYLHGDGTDGYLSKEDLGANSFKINILNVKEKA